ncbi:MAG: SDR family NAD(P)-dependent oxidoreductase [Alphaproteobacteria bacterium]|nr:SDR family NAD(P)-dependent oxidoreductase [Alphaproteobacteria bacterium]
MKHPTSILITGASSGLGAALAEAYATPDVRLALGGRDRARLEAIADRCRAAGAEVDVAVADVVDAAATARWVEGADDRRALDLVVANAGISAGSRSTGESAEQVRRILAVNIDGVINTILPALPRLTRRGRGQIALMASLAGYRGLPGAPAYCASKAAVKVFGEALRGELASKGVGVSVICPGYVDTPMTQRNRFPMPFLMDAPRAANLIKRRLAKNKARIAFPWPMAALVWLLQALPPGAIDLALARLPRKS